MSDIIGGENHFPLGFGSADRTFDLDFSAGDSTFGLDFGSAIIGGSSLPSGGTTGQVLAKASAADFDTAWIDPPADVRYIFTVRKSGDDLTLVNPPFPDAVIADAFANNDKTRSALLRFEGQGRVMFLPLVDVRYFQTGVLLPYIDFAAVNEANGIVTYLHGFGRAWSLVQRSPSEEAAVQALNAAMDALDELSEGVAADIAELNTNLSDDIASKYTKPSGGIPKSDLASDVQTSLGKADTALQSHQSLAAYRTAAAQDVIDAAQDTAIAGKLPTTGDAYRAASIPMGHLDSTSTATVMTATVPGITDLRDGVCVWLKNGVVSSASGVTLNINGLGAKPLYSSLSAASRSTTIFSSAYTLLLIFNSTRVDGGCWDVVYGIDTNTNTIGYQLRTNSATMPMASVVYRYRLLFTSADGTHLVPANNSSSTNATSSRTVCQTPIDPFGTIYYYGATASVAANANPAAVNLWTRYVVTLGYSFNRTGAALVLTPNVPVYIKCAPQTDGSAIIDADNPFVQTLPTTEDGRIYIFLGIAAAATTVEIQENHPVYCYRKGAVRKWTGLEAELDALLPASGVSF